MATVLQCACQARRAAPRCRFRWKFRPVRMQAEEIRLLLGQMPEVLSHCRKIRRTGLNGAASLENEPGRDHHGSHRTRDPFPDHRSGSLAGVRPAICRQVLVVPERTRVRATLPGWLPRRQPIGCNFIDWFSPRKTAALSRRRPAILMLSRLDQFGTTPSRPTLTRLASSVPSGFLVAATIRMLAPGLSSLLLPTT